MSKNESVNKNIENTRRNIIARELLFCFNCTSYRAPEEIEFVGMVSAYSVETDMIPGDGLPYAFRSARRHIRPIPTTTDLFRAWKEGAADDYYLNKNKNAPRLEPPKMPTADEVRESRRALWQGFINNGLEHLIPSDAISEFGLKK